MNIQNGQALTTAISAIDDYPIIPNCMVEVLPRTWPGINKIGGIAKVVKCHYIATSDDGTKENNDVQKKDNVPSHIDVRYVVMGGRERMVPMEYCRPAPEYDHQHQHQHPNAGNQGEQNNSTTVTVAATHARTAVSPKRIRVRNLRDRSALLGRCNLCGSLRSDCGSCDWVKEQQERKWILEQEKMGILVLSGSGQKPGPRQHKSESARARRRRRDTNVKQRSPRRFGKDKEIEDEISFRHSDSDSDEGSFDSSSDESFVFDSRNKDSRTRRHTVTFTSASKFHRRRTLLTSSSDSSEGDNDSSSTSSSDDDEILARLKAIHVPSAKLKIAKKRARRLARISSKRFPIHGVGIGTRTSNHSKLREASTHIVAQQRKERRLKTARKYKMSNEKYKARMRFLNRRLSAMSHKGTRTGTRTNAKKKKEADGDGDGDLSVVDENSSAGAKTRMGRKGIAKSVLESIGTKATSTDETAADILAEGEVTELSQRAQNNGENGEDEQQDELLSHFVVGTTSRDKLQHARADKDVPIQVQSKHIPKSKDSSDLDSNLHQHEKSTTSRQLSQSQDMYPNADSDRDEDDDGDEDEGMSMMSPTRPRDEEINESAVPNTNTTEPRETRKRIGFVDGEDIGEKEIDDDNDDNIDDGQNADVAMDNIREIEGTELTRNYAENEISGYYEEDPILNTFIQPEGEEVADNLPSDLVDRSADLAFWDLPGFYDQQEKDLTVDKIPSAEAAIYSLEVELKNVQSSSSMMAVERIKLLLTIESRW